MQKLWIYGAGGHATVVAEIISSIDTFEIVGFIDDDKNKESKEFLGRKIVGNLQKFKQINKNLNVTNMFIAIGNNLTREKLSGLFTGFKFPIVIHSTAVIGKDVEIGCGTIIMPGAIIEAKSTIGQHCIINNQAIIGHGSIIGDFCHISGGAVVSGQVIIEKYSFLGVNSCITQTIKIGKNCIIGAGSIITNNVPDDKFMLGNPARVISNYLKNRIV